MLKELWIKYRDRYDPDTWSEQKLRDMDYVFRELLRERQHIPEEKRC